jgi:hypothetical protein
MKPAPPVISTLLPIADLTFVSALGYNANTGGGGRNGGLYLSPRARHPGWQRGFGRRTRGWMEALDDWRNSGSGARNVEDPVPPCELRASSAACDTRS